MSSLIICNHLHQWLVIVYDNWPFCTWSGHDSSELSSRLLIFSCLSSSSVATTFYYYSAQRIMAWTQGMVDSLEWRVNNKMHNQSERLIRVDQDWFKLALRLGYNSNILHILKQYCGGQSLRSLVCTYGSGGTNQFLNKVLSDLTTQHKIIHMMKEINNGNNVQMMLKKNLLCITNVGPCSYTHPKSEEKDIHGKLFCMMLIVKCAKNLYIFFDIKIP